jgi:hypothetical protein
MLTSRASRSTGAKAGESSRRPQALPISQPSSANPCVTIPCGRWTALTAPEPPDHPYRRRAYLTRAGLLASLVGLALFVYFVRQAGVTEIADGIRRLGWGFLALVLLSGLRLAVRALAWMQCLEGDLRLRFRQALAACISGDALGNLTPLGLLLSEPAKAMFVRQHVPLMPSLSALAVENLLYSFTVVLMILTGTVALLFAFRMPDPLQFAIWGALAAVLGLLLVAAWAARRQFRILSGTASWLARRGVHHRGLQSRQQKFRTLEDRIYGFSDRNRHRLIPLLALESSFHVLGVAEVYVTLLLISDAQTTLLIAFILESVNRAVNVVFKFVPLRLGVDEAGTGLLTAVLGLGGTLGVTLAVIRKARVMWWTTVGVALFVHRGLTVRQVVESPELDIAGNLTAAPD